MSTDTYLNGEITVLQAARSKAQETLTRLDRALAALGETANSLTGGTTMLRKPGQHITPSGTPAKVRQQAIAEYQRGESLAQVAKRHRVHLTTVRAWILKSGGTPRKSSVATSR